MTYRLAQSLEVLRKQINGAYPKRSKASDGWIGDDAHKLQGDTSDHNPWLIDKNGVGVVTAYDFTHDPTNGVDIDKLSDILVASRDPRIKYVIANGLIAGPYNGWQWQENSGHYEHIHISVNPENCDDTSKWNIGEEEMVKIPDNDAWYSRYKKLMMQIRGRKSTEFTREEFKKNFVGQDPFRMVEVMSDNTEADRALKWQDAGRNAETGETQKKLLAAKKIVEELSETLR